METGESPTNALLTDKRNSKFALLFSLLFDLPIFSLPPTVLVQVLNYLYDLHWCAERQSPGAAVQAGAPFFEAYYFTIFNQAELGIRYARRARTKLEVKNIHIITHPSSKPPNTYPDKPPRKSPFLHPEFCQVVITKRARPSALSSCI